MDTRAIQTFLTIYQQRNLHKAAELLFISQQGLSRTLRSLEKELNCMLFIRTSAGLLPTPHADRFFDSASRIIREMDILKQDLRTLSGEEASLPLPCSYGTLHALYPVLQEFQKIHPEILLTWSEYPDLSVDRMLKDSDAPLALIITGRDQEDFEMLPLFSERFVLLTYEGHPYFHREALSPADLSRQRLILEGRQFHVYHNFLQFCSEEEIHPEIIAETTEIGLCINLCRMKEGISLVPESVSRNYRLDGLHAVPLDTEKLLFSCALAYKKDIPLPLSAQKFLDFYHMRNLSRAEADPNSAPGLAGES